MGDATLQRYPGLLPPPPPDLASRDLPIASVSSPWFRCGRSGRAPIHFGTTGPSRFGDPLGRFGVLYAGLQAETAFVEVFGGALSVPAAELMRSEIWAIVSVRPARLVDLTGEALAGLGLDARISAAEHGPSQAWSRALYEHPSQPEGILYRSRRDPSRLAVALYDRQPWTFEVSMLPAASLVQIATRYGIAVL